MYCNQCGAQAADDARFCTNCGRAFNPPAGAQPVPVYSPYPSAQMVPATRVQQHIRLLGILWIIFGVLRAMAVGWLWFVGRTILPHFLGTFALGFPLRGLIAGGIAFASALLLLQTVLAILAGWGLLEHQSWGRMVAIIAAILALLHIPLGTALGIYTLWVLLPAASETEYRNLGRA